MEAEHLHDICADRGCRELAVFLTKPRGLQFMLESGIATAGLMAGCLAG
jgi:hypothetical protein